jgi:hypothetical protein
MQLIKQQPYKRLLVFVTSILSLSLLTASARLEQIMLSINAADRKVTFTFYHFDSEKTAELQNLKNNLGQNVTASNSLAAISVSSSNSGSIDYKSGKFIFSKQTPFFIKNNSITKTPKLSGSHKHNLILTDDKSNHAILYTPNVSSKELEYALLNYLSTSKTKYKTAVITSTGSQCGFYKKNEQYNPYYLKEIKKPAQVLLIK